MEACIVADSVTKRGDRLTTLELEYPRMIHAQMLTHSGMLKMNSSSSRAIPVDDVNDRVKSNPAYPIYWGANKRGMGADEEINNRVNGSSREEAWKLASKDALLHASYFHSAGYHKQIVNRITEPFQMIKVVLSGTEFDNFFWLRNHCFSDDTEILTCEGWKKISDVVVGERVYTLNKETRKLEKTSVIDTISWKSEGKAVSLKGQGVDLLLSTKHKQLIEKDGKLVFELAENLVGKNPTLYKSCVPDEYDSTSHEYKFGRLMGFYLGNGWTTLNKSTGNYETFICKGGSKSTEVIDEYESIIKEIFPSVRIKRFTKLGVEHLQISGKDVYSIFNGLGTATKKSLPSECWDWGQSSLQGIFDGLLDADSSIHSQSGGLKYYTSSVGLANDMQRLALILGHSATLATDERIGSRSISVSPLTGVPYDIETKNIGYRVSINKKRNSPTLKQPVTETNYNGNFVCVTLEKHNTIYVRRNGKAVWSGNCDAQPEIRELATLMKEAMDNSEPRELSYGEWHTPYYEDGLWYEGSKHTLGDALKISASCCAQVSYRKLDKTIEKAYKIHKVLFDTDHPHMSPVQHQGTPIVCKNQEGVSHIDRYGNLWSANLKGWVQYRKILEGTWRGGWKHD